MSKSFLYWKTRWENSAPVNPDGIARCGDAWKALDLLAEYAAFYKYLPFTDLPCAWGGSMGRFFSGRWNTKHGAKVQQAIANYFLMNGYYAETEKFHTVDFVLALLKKTIADAPISTHGDLEKILRVIKEKTLVDYDKLNADAIYNKYHARKAFFP